MAEPDRLYPQGLRPWDLEPHYGKHVSAMTSKGLHAKHAIAIQLAWRDQRIETLEAELAMLRQLAEQYRAAARST